MTQEIHQRTNEAASQLKKSVEAVFAKNLANSPAEKQLILHDEIGDGELTSAKILKQIDAAGDLPIEVRINSPGGHFFEGLAIYNALRSHEPGTSVTIEGLAGSAASFVAMAGKPIRMHASAFIMIHNVASGLAVGDSVDMRRLADELDTLNGSLIGIYAAKTGLPADQIVKWMNDETWFNAEDAMKYGFIDEIIPENESVPTAKFDLGIFAKAARIPAAVMNKFGDQKPPTKSFSGRVWRKEQIKNIDPALETLKKVIGDFAGGGAAPIPSVTAISGSNSKQAETGQGNLMDAKKRAYLESIGLKTDATDDEANQFYALLSADWQAEADAAAAGEPVDPEVTAKRVTSAVARLATLPPLNDYAAACDGDKASAFEYASVGMSVGHAKAAYATAKSARAEIAAKDVEITRLKAELGTQAALNLGGAAAGGAPASSDIEATAKAEWSNMAADKKSEWTDEKNFVTFRKAEANGQIKAAKRES